MTEKKQKVCAQSRGKHAQRWAKIVILGVIVPIAVATTVFHLTQESGKAAGLDNNEVVNTNSHGTQAKTIGSETHLTEASESSVANSGTVDAPINNVTTGDGSPVTITNVTEIRPQHTEGAQSNVVEEDALRQLIGDNGLCVFSEPKRLQVPDHVFCEYFVLRGDNLWDVVSAESGDFITAATMVFFFDTQKTIAWPSGKEAYQLKPGVLPTSNPPPTPELTPMPTPTPELAPTPAPTPPTTPAPTPYVRRDIMIPGLKIDSMVFDQGLVATVSAPSKIAVRVSPPDADTSVVRYSSSNSGIFSVDARTGQVIPKKRGKAMLYAKTTDDRVKASIELYVGRNIALLVGEGSESAIQTNLDALGVVFRKARPKGVPYEVFPMMNGGRQALKEKIDSLLSGEVTQLDTVIFYFSGHGAGDLNEDGLDENQKGWLVFDDGTLLSPSDLHSWLGEYVCRKVIILGSSYSGVFYDALKGRGYRVLTACEASESGGIVDQYSLLGYGLFERAFCETGGWDMVQEKAIRCKGDSNGSGELNIREIYVHTKSRVGALRRSELGAAVRADQTVQCTDANLNSFTILQLP